jgi:hypothetical protein
VLLGAPSVTWAELPPAVQQQIDGLSADNTDAITATITALVTANPALGAEIAGAATAKFPADAALIAGAAANADPNYAQDIVAAVIAALPADQQDVQTAALGPLGAFQGPNSPGMTGPTNNNPLGAPLIAPFTTGTSPR